MNNNPIPKTNSKAPTVLIPRREYFNPHAVETIVTPSGRYAVTETK